MRPYLPGLLAVFFWGLAPLVLKDLVARSSPQFATSVAFSLVAVLLLPYFVRSWLQLRWKATTFAGLFACGVMLVSAFNLLTAHASSHVSGTLIGGIIALEPLMILVLHALLHRTPPSLQQAGGILVSIAGVGLLLYEQSGAAGPPNAGWAIGLVLLGAAIWSLAVVLITRLATGMGSLQASMVLVFLGACPFLLTLESAHLAQLPHLELRTTLELLFVACVATILSNVLWCRSVLQLGPARTGSLINLLPFFSVLFAYAMFGEALTPLKMAALCTIVLGVYVSSRK